MYLFRPVAQGRTQTKAANFLVIFKISNHFEILSKILIKVGITSWGLGCAVPGTYGVYARVTELVDWVAKQYGFTGMG